MSHRFNEWGLTEKREKAVQLVLGGMTQRDAYNAVYGPKPWSNNVLDTKASEMFRDPKVKARMAMLQQQAAERCELKLADVLEETRRIMLSTPAGVIDKATGKVKLPHELDPATAAAVQSFEIDDLGRIKYKFWDKNSALERAARILGAFKEDNAQQAAIMVDRIELVALQPLPAKKG